MSDRSLPALKPRGSFLERSVLGWSLPRLSHALPEQQRSRFSRYSHASWPNSRAFSATLPTSSSFRSGQYQCPCSFRPTWVAEVLLVSDSTDRVVRIPLTTVPTGTTNEETSREHTCTQRRISFWKRLPSQRHIPFQKHIPFQTGVPSTAGRCLCRGARHRGMRRQ